MNSYVGGEPKASNCIATPASLGATAPRGIQAHPNRAWLSSQHITVLLWQPSQMPFATRLICLVGTPACRARRRCCCSMRTLLWAGYHANRRYIAPESGSLAFSGGLRMRRELVSPEHDGAFCI